MKMDVFPLAVLPLPNALIISVEFLEDKLKAVVQAGAYNSKEEVIGHALEVRLAAHTSLRINTAELYRTESSP